MYDLLLWVGWGLTTLVSAFIGSYLASYLKKKGENLATHEDINKLVDQVRAVTTTTKEIEAKISGDVWDRQKRWELKREVLFDATRRLARIDEALLVLYAAERVESNNQKQNDPAWLNIKIDRELKWHEAAAAFNETKLFVAMTCGKETAELFEGYGKLVYSIAAGFERKDVEIYDRFYEELLRQNIAVKLAVREELAIDIPGNRLSA